MTALPDFTRLEDKAIELLYWTVRKHRGRDIDLADVYLEVRDFCLLRQQRDWFYRTSSAEWWNLARGVMSEMGYTPHALYPSTWYLKYEHTKGAISGV